MYGAVDPPVGAAHESRLVDHLQVAAMNRLQVAAVNRLQVAAMTVQMLRRRPFRHPGSHRVNGDTRTFYTINPHIGMVLSRQVYMFQEFRSIFPQN